MSLSSSRRTGRTCRLRFHVRFGKLGVLRSREKVVSCERGNRSQLSFLVEVPEIRSTTIGNGLRPYVTTTLILQTTLNSGHLGHTPKLTLIVNFRSIILQPVLPNIVFFYNLQPIESAYPDIMVNYYIKKVRNRYTYTVYK